MTAAAAGACNSALPAFEGLLRRRPLAVVNEGNANAFVTCGFLGPSLRNTTTVTIHFENSGTEAVTVTCTLVDRLSSQIPTYMPKSVTLPINAVSQIHWNEDDNNQLQFANLAASCMLPPSVGVRTLRTNHTVDVGQ